MPAYSAVDQVAGQGRTANLPNFVGELYKLSPLETPYLSLIGGLTGGVSMTRPIETWQDTIHRAPTIQTNAEGADASFSNQRRAERRNVATIHQYGVELFLILFVIFFILPSANLPQITYKISTQILG